MTTDPPEHVLQVQQLFVSHQSALRAFIFGLWPDPCDAEDILQEVFLTITRKASAFTLGTNFLAWARMVARVEVLAARRRRGRHEARLDRMLSAETVAVLAEACPEGWGSERRLSALTGCLEKLAPKARELVRLRYFEERGASQIALDLGRSADAVNVALSKTREKLRECMNRASQDLSSYA
ncbi:MAG: polymerase sigma factor CnrH [Verrucomicrobiota bacterium]